MDRNQTPALEFWATLSVAERKSILGALEADESLVDHDFSALPPQVRAGITAGLHPAGEESTTEEHGDAEEHTEEHGRRRRKRSDD